MPRVLITALSLLVFSCKTTSTPEQIHAMSTAGDIDGLIDAWSDAETTESRVLIVEGLSSASHDDRARAMLLIAASSTDPTVRVAAFDALSKTDLAVATARLIDGLADPWPRARQAARRGLRARGESAQGDLTHAAAENPHPLIRGRSLSLLVALAKTNESAKEIVAPILVDRAQNDDVPSVRSAAAVGIGTLRLENGRTVLRDLQTSDEDSGVRLAASKALKQLGPIPNGKAPVVAVLPIRDGGRGKDVELSRLSHDLREYVTARLAGSALCQVVDPSKVERALAEMKKIGRAPYDGDAPNAPELGRFKIANQWVFGSVSREAKRYTLILNRMDVSTLALIPGASVTVTGYRSELEQLKVDLVERFLAGFR